MGRRARGLVVEARRGDRHGVAAVLRERDVQGGAAVGVEGHAERADDRLLRAARGALAVAHARRRDDGRAARGGRAGGEHRVHGDAGHGLRAVEVFVGLQAHHERRRGEAGGPAAGRRRTVRARRDDAQREEPVLFAGGGGHAHGRATRRVEGPRALGHGLGGEGLAFAREEQPREFVGGEEIARHPMVGERPRERRRRERASLEERAHDVERERAARQDPCGRRRGRDLERGLAVGLDAERRLVGLASHVDDHLRVAGGDGGGQVEARGERAEVARHRGLRRADLQAVRPEEAHEHVVDAPRRGRTRRRATRARCPSPRRARRAGTPVGWSRRGRGGRRRRPGSRCRCRRRDGRPTTP